MLEMVKGCFLLELHLSSFFFFIICMAYLFCKFQEFHSATSYNSSESQSSKKREKRLELSLMYFHISNIHPTPNFSGTSRDYPKVLNNFGNLS